MLIFFYYARLGTEKSDEKIGEGTLKDKHWPVHFKEPNSITFPCRWEPMANNAYFSFGGGISFDNSKKFLETFLLIVFRTF